MIEAALIYMSGFITMILLAAVRTPNTEVRPIATLAAAWPVALPLVLVSMLLDVFGVTFEFDKVTKPFGFRLPTNTEIKGFAVTIMFIEFRVFTARVV